MASKLQRPPPDLAITQSDRTQETEFALAIEEVESLALEAVGAGRNSRNVECTNDVSSASCLDLGQSLTAALYHNLPAQDEPIKPGETDPMVGSLIGPYRVIARIGDRGMETVYRAARIEEFSQQVAVKLIKRAMDSDVIVRRFRREIHVHAALGKHPNITALLDAGTIEDGRPYFVMEYVDGQRIDEYCDSRCLDVQKRLKLVAQVCKAVHFAHQHAVIHRDLKPNNILVTSDGVPKLTDFGIAELVQSEPSGGDDVEETDIRTILTWTGELVLTPEYASPEQVKGESITTASDIYSLGVVLYQLLTGRRPYRLKDWTTSEIFRAICDQVPERPSTAVGRPIGQQMDMPLPTGQAREVQDPASRLGSDPVFTPERSRWLAVLRPHSSSGS